MASSVATLASGSTVIIAPATWRDLGALHQLEQKSFPKDAWPLWDLIAILTLPDITRLKAEVDGRTVGFIAIEHKLREETDWIATIGVLPEYQGRGIGRALLFAGEKTMRSTRMRLCVRASNETAQKLYLRSGYRLVETWLKYYEDGEDALVMEKRFESPPLERTRNFSVLNRK